MTAASLRLSYKSPAVFALALVATGCEQPESWSQTRLPNVSRDAAIDATVYAVRQWFRGAQVSPTDGTITSATTEYDQRGGTGRIRDTAIGFKNRMRHTATAQVRQEEGLTVVRCKVEVQRLDTADHRVFQDQQRFGDAPNQTPIDRDASIRTGQDQVWTDMPRDRKLESEILDMIRTRTTGGTATPTNSQ